MKKIIKKVALLVLLVTTSLTTKAADKAMQARDGEIKLETFKYVLRNRNTGVLQRNAWNKIYTTDPQTGRQIFQEVYIWAYLPAYMPEIMTEAQINAINVRPFGSVKSGVYRNNGYDPQGYKKPLKPNYESILINFNYFCDADGVAIAKTNCGNEQDWQDPSPPFIEKKEVPFAPQAEMMYVPCANVTVEMEPKDPSKPYQLSKGGAYAFRNGIWYYYTGIAGQEYKKVPCETPQATNTTTVVRETQIVYVDRPVQTMNALYTQQPVQQCCPEPRQRSYVGVGIALSFVNAFAPMIQQRQYTPYQPYTPNQPVQWNGTMSNSGSYYNNYGTGNSSNGGSGGYSTSGSSNGGGVSNGGSSNSGGGSAGQFTVLDRMFGN